MNQEELFNSLSDELKEKALNCKTREELLSLLQGSGVELDPELADQLSGGGDEYDINKMCPRFNRCRQLSFPH